MTKSLGNSDANGTRKNVKDVKFWGDSDAWKLICKAWSEEEGWMKSTKAMEIKGVGCLVQVTTQQENSELVSVIQDENDSEIIGTTMKNENYSITDSVVWVPGVRIEAEDDGRGYIVGRKLVAI